MKTNHLIKLAALLLVGCALLGCGKDKNRGSIYGTVTDFATGDPVGNANVRLNPRGETTLTGSDGTYQFNDVTDGSYSLSLWKNGYVDLDDDYVINIENGSSVRRDVQLRNQTTTVYVTVFNKVTHEPVVGAEVEIGQNGTLNIGYGSSNNYKITSMIAGADGQCKLQFGKLSYYDHFYIAASCNGFRDYWSRADFGTEGGGTFYMDINLEPN